ncbi:unnamed protein product [Bemisia tabaci]|uniref:DDE-1 domain-containing protein n=1 Tax=Bemisia tabaci TaxID=7038 RepID=A0A9P0F623_BEMTA|nr:unnamed protein product [Bemisia tabaci]
MDQGVFAAIKKLLRLEILTALLASYNAGIDVPTALKKVDMVHIINWVALAWDKTTPLTLLKSWKPLLDHVVDFEAPPTDKIDQQLIALLQQLPGDKVTGKTLDDWLAANELTDELTDEDIVNMVSKEPDDTSEENAGDSEPACVSIPHSQGYKSLTDALNYIAEQSESTAIDISYLQCWLDLASKKHVDSKRQRPLTAYFKPI